MRVTEKEGFNSLLVIAQGLFHCLKIYRPVAFVISKRAIDDATTAIVPGFFKRCVRRGQDEDAIFFVGE